VSPGKTIEGAAAGVVGGAVAAGLLTSLLLRDWMGLPVGVGAGTAAGVVLALVGQMGDLTKSVLKREAGVKDSGTLFPGHGGVLDRLDSLFFALPVAYGSLRFILG
jgi:phosphatidate cytidylyltransferase